MEKRVVREIFEVSILGSAIKKLHKYWRNFFVHQKPMTLFFTQEGIKPLVLDAINAIEFLALRSGNINYHDSPDKDKVKSLILDIKKFLKESK